MKKSSRIFIAGHKSAAGQALSKRLKKEGFDNLYTDSASRVDLGSQRSVSAFFKRMKPEYCFLMPVAEGGIEANINYPAELIYKNLTAQINVIHSAFEAGIKRLIFLASSCAYPRECPQPMKEDYILTGPPEPTNEPYSVAKIAGIRMCQAYNRQFGTDFISIIPATIYGPHDNFDLKTGHVVPALIRRFHTARKKKAANVTVWGSGRPRREFLYVDDLIDACLFIMRRKKCRDCVKVGAGSDISIKRLSALIKEATGYSGETMFDSGKPDGVFRKLLDSSYINKLGWRPKTSIEEGIAAAFKWYIKTGTN